MDKIDKIILTSIAEDCRQPLSAIGKRLRRSPQFVKYRLDNLKQKTIKNIPLIRDFYALGKHETTALITISIIDPLTEKILIDHLFKKTETYKLAYTSGTYSILCSFVVDNLSFVHKLKEELLHLSKDLTITFLVNTSTTRYTPDYLSEQTPGTHLDLRTQQPPYNEDAATPIIKELQADPFASLLEVSQRLGSSYDKTTYAFKHSTTYKGNTLLISEQHVQRSIILLNTTNHERVKQQTQLHKHVVEHNALVGAYDTYLIVEAEEGIKQHVKQLLYELKDHVSNYCILDANNWYKYGWYA